MEIETPPPLPPKTRKSYQFNSIENTTTLPSTVVIKQNNFIKELPKELEPPKVLKCTFKPIEKPKETRLNYKQINKQFQDVPPEEIQDEEVRRHKTNFTNTLAKFNREARSTCYDSRHDLNRRKETKQLTKQSSAFVESSNKKINETTWIKPKHSKPLFKINDWGGKKDEDVFLYQNVSNNGTNYLEYALNGIIQKETKTKSKNKSHYEDVNDEQVSVEKISKGIHRKKKIEVQQVQNKTVVKISVNEYQEPISLFNKSKELKSHEYAEPFANPKPVEIKHNCEYQKPRQVYANIDKSKKKNRRNDSEGGLIYENSEIMNATQDIYENADIVPDESEQYYANLDLNPRIQKDKTYTKKSKQDDNVQYMNIRDGIRNTKNCQDRQEMFYENIEDDDDDQVYENQEFEVLKNSKVTQSVIEKNPGPVPKNFEESKKKVKPYSTWADTKIKKEDDELYENADITRKNLVKPIPLKAPLAANGKTPPIEDGQTSPSETLDSGTGSDTEQQSPVAVPKKKDGKVIVMIGAYQSKKEVEIKPGEDGLTHKRAESITSSGVDVDSDAEGSNISCDSLNSHELNGLTAEDHGYHTPNSENKTTSPTEDYQNIDVAKEVQDSLTTDACDDIIQRVGLATKKIKSLRYDNGVYQAKWMDTELYQNSEVEEIRKPEEKKELPKGLLQDIRSRNVRLCATYPKGERENESVSDDCVGSSLITKTVNNFKEKIEKNRKPLRKPSAHRNIAKPLEDKKLKVNERTYEERKVEKQENICAMDIDTEKFYNFHLYENTEEPKEETSIVDESFAGYKDYLNRDKSAAITSAKGTIRGVKNRVRAGIATFLQIHDKTYKDKDAGKIVVYSTTMGIVRETYQKCLKVKQILKTLMVKFEERDVFMSTAAQEEIRERMKCDVILIPQVFVEGQHIGDAETIERLNESGELRLILKPYKSADACSTCKTCGGYRLLPCSICKGSKKSVHRNHFTAEFVSLKCMNCDPVGLVKCHAC